MPDIEIGKVSQFLIRNSVVIINLNKPLSAGDKIHIRGSITDLLMTVTSMQVKNMNVSHAHAGDSVGIKVAERVRVGDTVYRIEK